jgi:hypothetical protein
MHSFVKALKRSLRAEYPESVVSVRLKRASNYVDSSDRMVVYVSGASYIDVRVTLTHYTRGMAIYRTGGAASVQGDGHPAVWDVSTQTMVDADMCEFVEVQTDEVT